MALALERAIVREMAAAMRVRLSRRVVVDVRGGAARRARDDGREAERHASLAHFGERDGAYASTLSRRVGLLGPDRMRGREEIPAPLQRVHRQIEVGIYDDHLDISLVRLRPLRIGGMQDKMRRRFSFGLGAVEG